MNAPSTNLLFWSENDSQGAFPSGIFLHHAI